MLYHTALTTIGHYNYVGTFLFEDKRMSSIKLSHELPRLQKLSP